MLLVVLCIFAAPSPGRPQAEEPALSTNHRKAAVLDLEWLFQGIHANAESLSRYRSLSPGRTETIRLAEREPLWIWREDGDLLVGIDENLDSQPGSERPDSLEDVTVVDYDSDGSIDRILDWVDMDGDRRADRQILYALTPAPLGGNFLSCIVVEQRDRRRGFWHLERWQYVQSTCQWRSDFSGDLFHIMGRYDERRGQWRSYGENPFCFYDLDEDGLSEEALLLVGEDTSIRHMRWSFDADDDATVERPYDYDLSITAHGRHKPPASFCDSIPLRGGGRLPFVSWERAREFARNAPWRTALLTFDENDRNIAPRDPEARERWEGVIADAVRGFPTLGSPGCGRFNKRYEVNAEADTLLLYVSHVDRRIHLFGAEEGWIRIDEDGDGVCDGLLRMEDSNEDGLFDTWLWDEDGDEIFESIFNDFNALWDPVPVTLEGIQKTETRLLDEWRRDSGSEGGQAERFRWDVRRWREKGPAPD
jgi:hypothetical protein